MGLHALGDSAWLFKANGTSPQKKLELILRLRRILQNNPIPEIVDIVSSFDTIAVYFDPADGETVLEHLTSLHLDQVGDRQPPTGRTITIPVVYGSDLETLAETKKRTVSELIEIHSGTEFTVAAIGFSPGFPYLLGLPPGLHQPRLSSPRKVFAGSVAIAGDQTGIYPFASHGGWHVIGHTDTVLFDPLREHPSLLQPGDKIRFEQVRELGKPPAPPEGTESSHPGIHVIDPGAFSSVQDHGRWGRQHLGVSPGGAADPVLATIANRLVGNPDDAAVIECTMTGPVLRFDVETRISWVGWADGSSGRPHKVAAGETIDLRSRLCQLRGYIAVAGGIDVPEILGSRATDIRATLGGHQGRILKAGDTLPIAGETPAPTSEKWHVSWPRPGGNMIEIRYLRGIQATWFSEESYRAFSENLYEISPTFDRTGTRLKGSTLKLKEPREMVSQPVVFGSIQVPPDGQPIILMSERQTIGGYPQIGHVISADLPALARAWPGTRIHFREVDLDEARHAWNDLQRDLALLNTGLMMKLNES